MAVEGYNIAFRIGGNTIAGRTQDDLTIAARTKESLTKDDAGQPQTSITGHDITFRATALMDVTGGTGKISRDTLLADALATGSSAVLEFTYVATGGTTYGGKCVITNYTESSNASDEATITVDFRVSGAMSIVS